MSGPSPRKSRPPLDDERLRELALRYVGRFATTRARLLAYLERKVRERGWHEGNQPETEAMADRFVELGYVNDASYAVTKSAAMVRRGLGPRRIRAGLQADGIGEQERAQAEAQATDAKWDAAHALARRKRIGPYALAVADAATHQRQMAAFLRAGHDFSTARRWVEAAPGQIPEVQE
jgi:regulatory protein